MFLDSDIKNLALHLSLDVVAEVREAYLAFATSELREDLRVTTGGHGYIENELRYYKGNEWYFSAVLNKNWVLWYWRWPAIRDHVITKAEILDRFIDSKETKAKDIQMRVTMLSDARRVAKCLLQLQP